MVHWRVCLSLLTVLSLPAQDLRKLPTWAEAAAREVVDKPLPSADAWVVLDRTEMAYAGNGEIRTRKVRLVKVISERGLGEASYVLGGLGGKASKVNKLRGWNLRPDGELVKLGDDRILTSNMSNTEQLSTKVVTLAALPRVAKGSWVAFESQETFRYPTGPYGIAAPMGEHPVHRWELLVAKMDGWFTDTKAVSIQMEPMNFHPWLAQAEIQPGQRISVTNVPTVPEDESAHPHALDVLPWVLVRFQDPDLKDVPPTQSWEALGQYFFDTYQSKYAPRSLMDLKERNPEKALRAIHRWLSREMAYKQVYLAPERGWVPEAASETARKRYGDCKDLATCFISEVRQTGLKAFPVLCRINEGSALASQPVSPASFNHVILAVHLERSLGLPAEVETPKGRFLLVDATSRLTEFGSLPVGHRNREVLICTESGGCWTRIPATAEALPHLRASLHGEVKAPGRLDAVITFHEDADALGLRSACLEQGPQKMREFLLESILDLPPTGQLDVLGVGDPFDLGKPFEVTFKVIHPDGFHLQGIGEGLMIPMGLPSAPLPIQKPGKPRRYPVLWRGVGRWDYEARIRLPWSGTPILPDLTIETPFRIARWQASATPDEGGCTLRLSFKQQRKDAEFGFADRDTGLSEWKKDRSQMKNLLSDGLAFKFIR